MLEILPLMEKEVEKELASHTVTRNRKKKHSRGQRLAEKNRERVHLERAVSVKEQLKFSRKDICVPVKLNHMRSFIRPDGGNSVYDCVLVIF